MQRLAPLSALLLTSVPALADPGHLAQERGHTHWLGLAAIGAALVVAIYGYGRGRIAQRRRDAASAETT